MGCSIRSCLTMAVWIAAGAYGDASPHWAPVRDAVYLQEIGRQVHASMPLNAVAAHEQTIYVGNAEGVSRLSGNVWVAEAGPRATVHVLKPIAGALWAAAADGLWRRADSGDWERLAQEEHIDVAAHLDGIVTCTSDRVLRVNGEQLATISTGHPPGKLLGIASYSESVYVLCPTGVAFLQDGSFNVEDVEDWGQFPLGATARGLTVFGSRLFAPTNEGVAVLRGMSWDVLRGHDGLPVEDTTCVAAGFDRDWWVGTTNGAVRVVNGQYHYFAGPRWLPDDTVNAIAASDRSVYLATDRGLAIIDYVPYTLQKKADWYHNEMEARGMKRLGFIHEIMPKGDGYIRFLSDNDVGWACHYLDALCFEYAVTGNAAVRAEAVDIFKTIKWSEEITPIPGFPARAIHAVGQEERLASTGSAGRPSEWNRTEDDVWEWKGDTSSDEIAQQFYSVSIFYDLAAQGDEKLAARDHLAAMMDHIIDNGWCLRDLDGNCTVWARWEPEFIYSPDYTDERGLNALQALSMVAVANHVIGGEKYAAAKRQLIEWDYPNQLLRQKIVFPWYTHFDDRLAFLTYFPLLRYDTDPALRPLVMRSLQRSWEIKRIDYQPWFDYLYAILTANEFDSERAITHLREYPLDLVDHPFRNSHRDDLGVMPEGYRNYVTATKPMGPREQGVRRWDRDPLELDGGGSLRYLDPSSFLDAYWMARYFGLILPPDTEDPALLKDNAEHGPALVAPYAGPQRPEIF